MKKEHCHVLILYTVLKECHWNFKGMYIPNVVFWEMWLLALGLILCDI